MKKTVAEFKQMCRENYPSVTGMKNDLIQRLTKHLSKQENPNRDQQNIPERKKRQPRSRGSEQKFGPTQQYEQSNDEFTIRRHKVSV